VGGRVVSEYRGGGALAGVFQAFDALDAQDAPPPIEKPPIELVALDQAIEDNWREIKTMLAAALVAGGYHNHKGQWRKKRRSPMNPETSV